MKTIGVFLTPLLGIVAAASCTSTTSSPVVVCGPDSVATTNLDLVAATNYEAAWYYASLDPIVFGAPFVADAPVGNQALSSEGDPDGGLIAPADGGFALTDAGVSVTSNAAATAVAAAVGRYFLNGCATATANGNIVTFKLNNCTGPLGMVVSSGTFIATFSVVGNTIQTQLTGSNLRANGATVNLSTSGMFSVSNDQKTLQANSQSTGTGAYGNSITHMGMYSLVWPTGTGCATINGSFSGVGSGSFSGTTTQITNYVACMNQCPQSGMTLSSFNGGSVTLTFNGSSNAQCSASNGASAAIPLNCP